MHKVKQSSHKVEIGDCWNQIGVWGKQGQTCEKLDDVIHCYNCAEFISAGRLLFDREATEEYREEWHKLLNKDKHSEIKSNAAVVFRLGDEWFALQADIFQEIIKSHNVHRIPHNRNPFLKGLVSIRGELLLCISLGQVLGIEKGAQQGEDISQGIYKRMVVIETGNHKYVFPVSEIRDMHHYADSELEIAPATAHTGANSFLKGVLSWKDKYVGCLDQKALLSVIDGSIG